MCRTKISVISALSAGLNLKTIAKPHSAPLGQRITLITRNFSNDISNNELKRIIHKLKVLRL